MFAFLVRERRRFASGSDRDNSGDPRGDLCLDQFFESRIVNAAIAKWRDQRSKDAPKHVTNCRTTYSIVMSSEVETSLIISPLKIRDSSTEPALSGVEGLGMTLAKFRPSLRKRIRPGQ